MKMMSAIKNFRDDDSGSMAVELMLVVPILVWALMSTFVYFDLYRVEANANRAALTLADMFSREDGDNIDSTYLNGARSVLRALTYEEADPDYRVTAYTYRETQGDYRRIWSRKRGDISSNVTNAILSDLDAAGRLPAMADGDRAILLETRVEYDAPFSIGLGQFTGTNLEDVTFETFIVIRPRAGRLCFETNAGNVQC